MIGPCSKRSEALDADVLFDRMERWRADRVGAGRINACDRIGRAAIARQKLAAGHAMRNDCGKSLLKFIWRNIGQISVPRRVIDFDYTVRIGVRLSLNSRRFRDDSITHERPASDGRVVRSAHRMPNARIDSPKRDSVAEFARSLPPSPAGSEVRAAHFRGRVRTSSDP